MKLPVIILGAGGHAKVLVEALIRSSVIIEGILDANPGIYSQTILGVPVIGDDDVLSRYMPSQIRLVNGLGSTGLPDKRQKLFEKCSSLGYRFASVIHPSAVIASDMTLGEGAQIMAGAVVQPGCSIGSNSVINTKASVDHDCTVGDHVHISPGVTLSGGVMIGNGSHIGTGATIIQGVSVGPGSFVAAGAVVIRNLNAGSMVRGVPAREFL